MLIRWLTIFLLLAAFILISSNGLPVNNTDTKDKIQWSDTIKDVNLLNGRPDSLSKLPNDSGTLIEDQEIPTLLNHQETKNQHKEDERTSGRMDYLIAALSKIAKVRFEEESVPIQQDLTTNVYNAAQKSTDLRNGVSVKDTGTSTLHGAKLSSKLSSNGISYNSSSNGMEQENFHCQHIQDIYIAEIKENVPSYLCITGSKWFILASKRFFQDLRNSLHVNVDGDILRKLKNSASFARNQFNVIPAVLILKSGHEDYDVRI